MVLDLLKIQNSKNIAIVSDLDSLACANALYSYILTLHKKVTLVCDLQEKTLQYDYLPWADKVRRSTPVASDCIIDFNMKVLELYEFFRSNKININQKMATSMYGAVLLEYDGFKKSTLNGTVFALSEKLLACGIDHKKIVKSVFQNKSLAYLRQKSYMLKTMLIKDNATTACFYYNVDEIKASGSTYDDCIDIMNEAFLMPSVENVILLNEKNEILEKKERKF